CCDLMLSEGDLDGARRLLKQIPPGVGEATLRMLTNAIHIMSLPVDQRRAPLEALFGSGGPVSLPIAAFVAAAGYTDLVYPRLLPAIDAGDPIDGGPVGIIARAYTASTLFHFRAAALRQDPRFARVCAKLGLAAYWQSTGTWPDCAGEVPYDFKAECAKALRS